MYFLTEDGKEKTTKADEYCIGLLKLQERFDVSIERGIFNLLKKENIGIKI